MKPNPDYENARYELNIVDRAGRPLISHAQLPARFNELPPMTLNEPGFAQWAMVHAVPPFVE